ncbi:hypothetical protein BC830DRAFT_425045 [Chytriomyces sp. MP71]|nr:hypothetical protein BC830DRAFT_425045 [Chytriomyces sp. MP71]
MFRRSFPTMIGWGWAYRKFRGTKRGFWRYDRGHKKQGGIRPFNKKRHEKKMTSTSLEMTDRLISFQSD